jgi:putative flippase GtrA
MTERALRLWAYLHTPMGVKMVRYTLVSVISVGISLFVLFITYGVLRLWSAVPCNIFAAVVATPPSYYLNRRWAWGKTGRSHLMKEIVPFWALAFLGLGVSVVGVHLAESWGRDVTSSHLAQTLIVTLASAVSYGVVWVAKFIIFNRLMFIDHAAKAAEKRRRKEALLSASAPPAGIQEDDDGLAVAADG